MGKSQHKSLDNIIYVLDKHGRPLRPMSSPARVRKKLESKRAVIVNYEPFTIQLTYELENERVNIPECVLGIDPGGDNIGLNVIDESGLSLFSAKVRTRNSKIPKLMQERATHRRYRRCNEKARRNRKEVQAAKMRDEANPGIRRIHRVLPGCDEVISCHVTRNTQARFNNRKRPDGWLTPTANQLLLTHVNLVKMVSGFLPISKVSLEVNKFDIALMEADGNRGKVDYRTGPLSGYEGVEDAIRDQQGGVCLLCGKNAIDHFHHIVPRDAEGSNTVGNIAGLCGKCHDRLHKDEKLQKKLSEKKAGFSKKYRVLTTLNQVMPRLMEELPELGVDLFLTTGLATKKMRDELGLPKDHHIDAWCIARAALGDRPPKFVPASFTGSDRHDIMQFRRHDRQRTRRIVDRKYYLDGKLVARNRHRRTGQDKESDISLAEFAEEHPEDVARLTVKPAVHTYNDMERLLPGIVFLYEGQRYVSFGCQSNGKRFTSPLLEKGYVPVNKCRVVDNSTGLVFLGTTLDTLDSAREDKKKSGAPSVDRVVSRQRNDKDIQEGGLAGTARKPQR